MWPATAVLVAFAWFELVYPESGSARSLGIAALVYVVYTAALAVWAGRQTGPQIGDAFHVFHRMVSSLAPLGRSGTTLVRQDGSEPFPFSPVGEGSPPSRSS